MKTIKWVAQRIIPAAVIGPGGKVVRYQEQGTTDIDDMYVRGPHDCRYGVFTTLQGKVCVVDFHVACMSADDFKLQIKTVVSYPDLDTAIMTTIMGYKMSLLAPPRPRHTDEPLKD